MANVSSGLSLLLLSIVLIASGAFAIHDVGTPLIIKGDIASGGEFPHIVQLHLLTGGIPCICGGSIIAPNIILTAAHCLEDFVTERWTTNPLFSIKVVAGALDWYAYGLEDHTQKRRAVQFVRHESFNKTIMNIRNDVAVLVLSHPLNYTQYVQPIQLPTQGQVFEGLADICGWGLLQNSDYNYKPKKLRKAKVHLHNDTSCQEKGTTWRYKYDNKTMMCAGGLEADTCQGDSGGPMVCESGTGTKKSKVLCGITSWGVNCGATDVPGMFTRVSTYTPWIQKQISLLSKPCRPDEFYCGATPSPPLCISHSRVCDGKRDCMNGVDETDCSAVEPCASDCLSCGSGECMPAEWACDGTQDCVDGSDEDNARCRMRVPKRDCDVSYEFTCDDGTCIFASRECDGFFDCTDCSDEKESRCDGVGVNASPPPPREGVDPVFELCDSHNDEDVTEMATASNSFRCKNGQCVSRRFRCDGVKDCQDSSDELNCANHTCTVEEFQCAVGHCIPLAQKCDNELDCTDQSDELNATCWDSVCGPSKHKCDTGQCLDTLLFCDGHPNCADGSDESPEFCRDYLLKVPEARSHSVAFILYTSAQLTCFITPGNSSSWLRPELEWVFDGNVITDDARLLRQQTAMDSDGYTKKLTLLFPNVTLADMGDYACRVGSAGHEFVVRVIVGEHGKEQEDEGSTTDVASEPSVAASASTEQTEPSPVTGLALLSTMTLTFLLLEAAFGLTLVFGGLAYKWCTWRRRTGFEGLINEAVDNDDEGAEVDAADTKTDLEMYQL